MTSPQPSSNGAKNHASNPIATSGLSSASTTENSGLRTTALFVRHTDVHNPDNVFYGRLPRFHLSELGRTQAERTAEYLAKEPIDRIFSSPQLRARQTARAIAQYHPEAPLRISRLISEVYTSWQGTPFSTLGASVNVYEPLKEPNDESITDIFRRMNAMMQLVFREYPGEKIVCVSHADPIMILRVGYEIGYAQGLREGREVKFDFSRLRSAINFPEKGSITRFVLGPGAEYPTISYTDPGRLVVSSV